jgi:ubiquinone/menaquinone biosynthesis C-methylase UbiE
MTEQNAAFVGQIPENYDRYLGPIYFHHYADDLASRLVPAPGQAVLEVACGTGILTRRLMDRLRGRGSLLATDLNDAMIAHGRARVAADPALQWRQADAMSLPFADRSFDAVVCQFGLMFLPDKARGMQEAFRVLRPGGVYLFNVWDDFAHNAFGRITHETVAGFFETDPPQFYTVPFGYHDPAVILGHLDRIGFDPVRWEYVAKTGTSPSAADAAIGLIEGNPILGAIMDRRPEALADIERAVAARLATELGDRPLRCHLRALVFEARRPAG